MRIKPTVRVIARPVSLVPLVDVFFLLLIFFLISSSVVFWPGTKVETNVRLPPSRVSSMSVADKLVITITNSGHLFFNDKNVGWDDLERDLKELVRDSREASSRRTGGEDDDEAVKRSRNPLVVLRADKDISYERIVDVISLARSLDLWVYLVTDPAATEGKRPSPILGAERD